MLVNRSKSIALIALAMLLLLGGCSDRPESDHQDEKRKDHVWKDQVDMLDKAKALEDMTLDSAEKRRQQIEDQGG